ncbi:hypothetical protein RE0346_27040 [Prescottella equi]|nr:hypothetical protein RE0346_27040 [Prescottella equi]
MLATLGEPPASEGWAFKMKWNGLRAVTDADRSGTVRLFSRNGNDITGGFPGTDPPDRRGRRRP